jgi:hypothetical protein
MIKTATIVVGVFATGILHAQHRSFFDAPIMFSEQVGETELLVDVDLDGDVDAIAVRNLGSSFVLAEYVVLRNDGAENWTAAPAVTLPSGTGLEVTTADVNGDGRVDLVFNTGIAHALGRGVEVYLGQADGTFVVTSHTALPGNVYAVFGGHGNSDGIEDVLVVHFDTGIQPLLHWLLGDATGSLVSGMQQPTVFSSHHTVADIDGDGLDDFLLIGGTPEVLGFVRTTATGFVLQGSWPVVGSGYTTQLLAMDFEGDGDRDILITRQFSSLQTNLVRFENLGSGAFAPAATGAVTGIFAGTYFAGDWDNDGLMDLVARTHDSGSSSVSYHSINLLRGNGAGFGFEFSLTIPVPFVGSGSGAGVADIDGDGNLDFVDSKAIYFGDGSFSNPAAGVPSGGLLDWDDDGDLDRDYGTKRNDGRGVFLSAPVSFPTPPGPNQSYGIHAVVDLGSDGLRDYLVQRSETVGSPWPQVVFLDMRLLQQTAVGNVVDLGPAAAPGVEMEAGGLFEDADGDGDLDYLNGAGVWANDGTGFFSLVASNFGGYAPIAKGDIDGDGDVDFLASLIAGNGLAILSRTGPATYTTTVLNPTIGVLYGTSATLADLDDDGDLDVAARSNLGGNQYRTSLFENVAGTLSPVLTLAQYGTLSAGDVDGDGLTDLCVINKTTKVLRRTGPGFVYADAIEFAFDSANQLADLDQDGDMDLCGFHTLWNRTFDGDAAGMRRQYGFGSVGTGMRRPLLSVTGAIRGGLQPSIRLRNAVGGSVALLLLGSESNNGPSLILPGVTSYVGGLNLIAGYGLPGALWQEGVGALDLPVALPTGLGGARLFLQFVMLDAGAPSGWSNSNGCEMLIGN